MNRHPDPGAKREKKKRLHKRRRIYGARGNMDVTGALIRCAISCAAFILTTGVLRMSGAYALMDVWSRLLLDVLLTLLFFGLPAYLGLCIVDDDQTGKLPQKAISADQLRFLAPLGVLSVCPMTLTADLIAGVLARFGLETAGAAAPAFVLFLPMAVSSALVAPVCEELFFRGYFFTVLTEAGSVWAAAFTSLFFSLVHGVGVETIPLFALGMLLCALMRRTQSFLAPVIVHAAYNLTLLLIAFSGLGGLFSGLGLVSCTVRLLGCAAFMRLLTGAFTAHGTWKTFSMGKKLTPRQSALIVVALIMFFAALVLIGRIDAMDPSRLTMAAQGAGR